MTFPIQVFDPPLCCSTGVCGTDVDPELVRFAADLDWLAKQGVEVERFNLAQQPGRFADDPVVASELAARGNSCLPLILAVGAVAARGRYPSRAELATYADLDAQMVKAATDALVKTQSHPSETKTTKPSSKSCC